MQNYRFVLLCIAALAMSQLFRESPGQAAELGGDDQRNIFIGQLVLKDLIPPDDRKFQLVEDLEYIDPKGDHWYARSGLVFDGASIPRVSVLIKRFLASIFGAV